MANTDSASKSKFRFCKLLSPILIPFTVLLSVFAIHAFGAVYYPGDVNSDKDIDVSDAVLLARFCAEDENALLSRQGMTNADADNNHAINNEDIIHILKYIANILPAPQNPYLTNIETTNTEVVTTSETQVGLLTSDITDSTTISESETTTETTVTTTVTTVTTTETTVTTTTTAAPVLMLNGQEYPLDVPISVLTGNKMPNETLTVNHRIGNIIYAIFADDPVNTTIAIAYQNNIVGYYKFCNSYTLPDGYRVQEYCDKLARPANSVYAVTILRKDVKIGFDTNATREDLYIMARLNYYAINGLRAVNGLPALEWHPRLEELARSHSMDMAEKNYFDHVNADGFKMGERFLNSGIDYMCCGENIDKGVFNPFDALDGWFCSSLHRNNLLSDKFTHVGVAFAYNSNPNANQCYYGTQDFCSFFPE